MRAREFLIEKSRGLLYRAPGDAFKDPQGQEIRFSNVTYYPGMPGAYADIKQTEAEKKKVEAAKRGIQWSNTLRTGLLSFAVLEFDVVRNGQLNGKKYFGRFFKQISPDMTSAWKNDELPGTWQLQKASSLKSSFKLKPTDIFPPNSVFATPQDLINDMANSQNGAQWAPETAVMLGGRLPIYRSAKDKETAIRDDLGEILSPIALVQNMIESPGLTQAKKDLNDNNDWNGKISFPNRKNEGLIDSEVILTNGTVLGISSKGKTGATASIKNAFDGYEKILAVARSNDKEKAAAAQQIINTYASAASVLDKIAKASSIDGPLELGENFQIINQADSNIVRELINGGHKNLSKIKSATQQQKDNLIKYAVSKADVAHPKYNIGFHILAGIAHDVAQKVNSDPNINFSEACLKFINSSPIVQIYTSTSVSGDDVKIDRFDALYPPNFKGNLLLDASKVYYATGTNGRYTFAFSPTKAAPEPAAQQAEAPAPSKKSKPLIKKPTVKTKTRTKRS